ncbi:hypothetical protein [uncultured Parolsenella sp.]|uniref:hypothetical protein n=1 Tax=uncultured Parolsenella sp. TaxID=2083008 RepID=UPI0025FA737C|nr:hypothetical protein [uncultured Parolsenella sp.]
MLAAIANSESNYYQAGTGASAYMEEALGKLGFTDVSTVPFRYRSEVIDEAVAAGGEFARMAALKHESDAWTLGE